MKKDMTLSKLKDFESYVNQNIYKLKHFQRNI